MKLKDKEEANNSSSRKVGEDLLPASIFQNINNQYKFMMI